MTGSSRLQWRARWDILRVLTITGLLPLDWVRCPSVSVHHFCSRQAGRILKPVLSAARLGRSSVGSVV